MNTSLRVRVGERGCLEEFQVVGLSRPLTRNPCLAKQGAQESQPLSGWFLTLHISPCEALVRSELEVLSWLLLCAVSLSLVLLG